MSLMVEFQISGPPLTMPDAAAAVPDVTLEFERWRDRGQEVHWYVWADGERLDRVTAAFEDLPNVPSASVVNGGAARRLYRVTMEPAIDRPPNDIFMGGTVTGGRIRAHCLHFTARATGRDVITSATQYLQRNDIDLTVLRLSHATTDRTHGRLTDPQFEALVTAYEMGYFDANERVTQREIADELGISRSSLSERLRRAEAQLVEAEIGFVE
jgi:predicted DNA binding protein